MQLPDYIAKAVPNPAEKRAPWYANTAPSYAGIFLWVAFYESIAQNTLTHASRLCLPGGAGVRLGALLRLLLSCPGHARDEDRLAALRGGQFHVRDQRRLCNAGPSHGTAADRLVRGGYGLRDSVHSERDPRGYIARTSCRSS